VAVKVIKIISWMHPSYRDLVIEELISDHGLRIMFLETMSVQGIQLAVSDTGGGEGLRRLPLMTDPQSWDLLRSRCVDICKGPISNEEARLLVALAAAAKAAQGTEEVAQLTDTLRIVCDSLRAKWDSAQAVLNASTLHSYCQASELLRPLPPLPILDQTWISACGEFDELLSHSLDDGELDAQILEAWTGLLDVIRKNEPRFLRQNEFLGKFSDQIYQLFYLIDSEVTRDAYGLSREELSDVSLRFEELKDCLVRLGSFDADWDGDRIILLNKMTSAIERLADRSYELDDSEDYDDYPL
jgi:hypothetical protein